MLVFASAAVRRFHVDDVAIGGVTASPDFPTLPYHSIQQTLNLGDA